MWLTGLDPRPIAAAVDGRHVVRRPMLGRNTESTWHAIQLSEPVELEI